MSQELLAVEDTSVFFQQDDLQKQNMDNIILTESKSYEDPVLIKDRRVLENILRRQQRENHQTPSYFDTVQTEIKPHMRKIVSDWMLEVTEEQQCQPEVFSLAINYMDRFLEKVNIRKTQFQLLACVCMFIASKFKETAPLPAENLIIYTDNSITAYEITQWELLVLQVIGWDLSAVTPYSVLDHLIRALGSKSPVESALLRRHAETFVALAATEHQFCQSRPDLVASACLAEAVRGLNVDSLHDTLYRLEAITNVSQVEIRECMNQIGESMKLSMSGMSFQPNIHNNNNNNPPPPSHSSTPKIIPQQPGLYGHVHHSTTPTDLMEISSTCVY